MTKKEFLAELRTALSNIPEKDIDDRIGFYSEMIDDRMEEGLSEEDAVLGVGSIEQIVSQITSTHMSSVDDNPKQKRKFRVWEIVLLVFGSPIWGSLLISAAALIFSLYVTLWSLIISLWAVEVSLGGTAFGAVAAGGILTFTANAPAGIAMVGAGFICAGLSIFLFFGCRAATKCAVVLTKNITVKLKKSFAKRRIHNES